MSMQPIYDWIDAHAEECVGDLQRLVRQPSISAQGVGLRECAELVREIMHDDELPADFHELDEGPPVVFGHLKAKKPAKTILCSLRSRSTNGATADPGPATSWTACSTVGELRTISQGCWPSTKPRKPSCRSAVRSR